MWQTWKHGHYAYVYMYIYETINTLFACVGVGISTYMHVHIDIYNICVKWVCLLLPSFQKSLPTLWGRKHPPPSSSRRFPLKGIFGCFFVFVLAAAVKGCRSLSIGRLLVDFWKLWIFVAGNSGFEKILQVTDKIRCWTGERLTKLDSTKWDHSDHWGSLLGGKTQTAGKKDLNHSFTKRRGEFSKTSSSNIHI